MRSSGMLEKKLARFSDKQKKLIFQNVAFIQLTEGCNTGCSDCGLGAKKGVRDFISYKLLKNFFTNYKEELGESCPPLFYASEPYDYKDGEYGYEDIHKMFIDLVGNSPEAITTSIPKGKEKIILNYLLKENNLGGLYSKDIFLSKLSLTTKNYARVNEAFIEMQKESGGKKFKCLNDFVKYQQALRDNQLKFCMVSDIPYMRDFYNEKICKKTGKEHSLFLGEKSFDKLDKKGIGCSHGALITPLGVFNLQTVKTSRQYPTGQIITPINPKEFNLIPLFQISYAFTYGEFLRAGKHRINL